jgi:hypothetical protein
MCNPRGRSGTNTAGDARAFTSQYSAVIAHTCVLGCAHAQHDPRMCRTSPTTHAAAEGAPEAVWVSKPPGRLDLS